MKKILLSFSLFFAVFQTSEAQFHYGLQAGLLNNTLIGFGKPQNIYPKTSFMAGMFTDYYISEYTSVYTEYRYERRSFSFRDTIPFVEESKVFVDEHIDCIAFPVHLKFKAGDEYYNAYLLFGAEFSFPLYAKQTLDFTIQDVAVDATRYANFEHNFWDYGLTTAFGGQTNNVVFKLGIYYGLGNVYQGRNIMEIRQAFGYGNIGVILNYNPPPSYRKSNPIKNLKYRWKKSFGW